MSAIDLLDGFYAAATGCSPDALRAGKITVVECDLRSVWFAKGSPLALYALDTGEGAVVSAVPDFADMVEEALDGATALDDPVWMTVEHLVSPLADVEFWFEGVRLYCEPSSFEDLTMDGTREILPGEDGEARARGERWGGKVFGHVVDGVIVCRVAVKALSDVVWDLGVETVPGHRGRGYARSAVCAASKYVFANGRLAGWGCDSDNIPSLRVARAAGFQLYGHDFGCVGRVSREACDRRRTARR